MEYIDWQNTKILQKAVLVDEENNILLLKRSEKTKGSRPRDWDLVGGSIRKEDLLIEKDIKPHEVAMRREIEEETHLHIFDIHITYIDSWVFEKSPGVILGIALGYVCHVKSVKPEIVLSEEHSEYKWVTKQEVNTVDFGNDGGLHHAIIMSLQGKFL